MDYTIETLISENDIKLKISQLANRIRENYKSNEEIIFVGLLRGSVIFLSDLARELSDYDVKIDFMTVSSYGKSMESSRDVKVKKDLEEDIQDKNVLIVEDIIDTGYTLKKVFEMLTLREPKTSPLIFEVLCFFDNLVGCVSFKMNEFHVLSLAIKHIF